MFERFTKAAREAVVGATEVAQDSGAGQVDEHHLLTSLLRRTGLPRALDLDDATVDQIVDALRATRRRAGLSDVDADALASIGIDLDAVISHVERELGEGALDAPRSTRRRRGHLPLTDGIKAALQGALRQAVLRKDSEIRPEHLLLGLLMRRTPVTDTLATYGITIATVYDALDHRRSA